MALIRDLVANREAPMTPKSSAKLYRVRVGDFVYEDLSVSVIIKNIRSGKLKMNHEIALSGSESWMLLCDVPELARFFMGASPSAPGPALKPMPELKPVFEPKPEEGLMPVMEQEAKLAAAASRYDVRRGEERLPAVQRIQLKEMIRKGELTETDMLRASPDGDWIMAGDMDELRRYFDLRRGQIADHGFRAEQRVPKGRPFYVDLAAPFLYIGNMRFLLNLIAIMIFFAIAFFVPVPIVKGPILFLTSFYLYSYYFRVVANASVGGRTFPEFSDMADLGGGLIRPGIQFFLTHLASVAPLFIYIVIIRLGQYDFFTKAIYTLIIVSTPWLILFVPIPTDAGILSLTFLYTDGIVWAALVFWLLYVPISLMRQASYGEFWPALNLPAVFVSIGRALGPYLALIFYLLAIDLIGILVFVGLAIWYGLSMLGPAGEAVSLFQAPFGLLIQALIIVGAFLKMFFIGRFLFQYCDKMGWD